MLASAIELERSNRLKKVQELRRKDAEERKRKRGELPPEEEITFGSDDEELFRAALALENDQPITISSTRTKPRHKRIMTSKEKEDAMMMAM